MAEEQEEMFPELARRALEARGLNPHSQRRLTGIDHVTMGGILGGVQKVSLETVEKFARGLGLDVNRARQSAGYPAVAAYDGRAYLAERITELAHKHELANIPVEYLAGVEADTPPEVVDLRIERLDAELLRLRDEKVTKA